MLERISVVPAGAGLAVVLRCGSCRYAGYYLLAYLAPVTLDVRPPLPVAVLGGAYVVLLGLAGELSNRVADRVEDQVNNPERTYLCELVGYPRLAVIARTLWTALSGCTVLLVVLRPSLHLALLLLVYGLLGYMYSFGPRFKRRSALALLILTQTFTEAYLVAQALDPSARWLDGPDAALASALMSLPLAIVGLKDLTDVRGDRLVGYRSVWLRFAEAAPRLLRVSAGTLPAAVVVAGVLAGLFPARMLLVLAVSPVVLTLVTTASRVRTENDRWAVRESMYYILLLFAVALIGTFYWSAGAVAIAAGCVLYWLAATHFLHWRRTVGSGDIRRLTQLLSERPTAPQPPPPEAQMDTSLNQTTTVDGLPPGPRLPTLVQTALFLGYPHRWLPSLHRRYGDLFTVRILQLGTVVIVGNVEHIRTIFTGPPAVFHAGESNEVNRSVVGDQSVVLLDEDRHLRMRRLLTPAFNGAALRRYQHLFDELAEAHVEDWPQGRPFSMQHQIEEHTLEIILRVVFGVADPARLAQFRPPVTRVVRMTFTDMIGLIFPPLQRIEPWRRYRTALRHAHRLLDAEIAARRDAADLAERRDVLSRLLSHLGDDDDDGLSLAELRDQAMTLLLAGHHTTATSLAWTFHELARNPQRLREAQRAADDGDEAYLEAVVKEVMRLHPVLYEVVRRLTEPTQIGTYRLPAGATVAPAIGIVQSAPAHHPGPKRFCPHRFSGDPIPPGTWIPFGGGVRRCPGAGFALAEAVAVLKAALTRYDISAERPEPEQPKARNILLVPSRGARVVVTARRD